MRRADKTWQMHQIILFRFAVGFYKPDETLMIITPTGRTTKTILEWVTEWFPAFGSLYGKEYDKD